MRPLGSLLPDWQSSRCWAALCATHFDRGHLYPGIVEVSESAMHPNHGGCNAVSRYVADAANEALLLATECMDDSDMLRQQAVSVTVPAATDVVCGDADSKAERRSARVTFFLNRAQMARVGGGTPNRPAPATAACLAPLTPGPIPRYRPLRAYAQVNSVIQAKAIFQGGSSLAASVLMVFLDTAPPSRSIWPRFSLPQSTLQSHERSQIPWALLHRLRG
jgi:hypothetical protein